MFVGSLQRLLASVLPPTEKGAADAVPFSVGASNGNRTRIASLGSWSFTIRLYPRAYILYIKASVLSRGFRKIPPEHFVQELHLVTALASNRLFSTPSVHIRLAAAYDDNGNGETVSDFIYLREVHYEQLSLQCFRQQQLDLDRTHRPAFHLLLRLLI